VSVTNLEWRGAVEHIAGESGIGAEESAFCERAPRLRNRVDLRHWRVVRSLHTMLIGPTTRKAPSDSLMALGTGSKGCRQAKTKAPASID